MDPPNISHSLLKCMKTIKKYENMSNGIDLSNVYDVVTDERRQCARDPPTNRSIHYRSHENK